MSVERWAARTRDPWRAAATAALAVATFAGVLAPALLGAPPAAAAPQRVVGTIVAVAGGGGDGFLGPQVAVAPAYAATDAAGNTYVSDTTNHRLLQLTASGAVNVLAGTGVQGTTGDGGPARSASLDTPRGVATDAAGNVFVGTAAGVRRIDPSGTITQFGAAVNADGGLATGAAGNVFVGRTAARQVVELDSNGNEIAVIGSGAICTPTTAACGDGGAPAAASITSPTGIAVAPNGDVYIADRSSHRVRRVSGGTITTAAGSGTFGFGGDGGGATAAAARLNFPQDVIATNTDLYIADRTNNRVRRVTGGIITTVVGSGTAGFAGDGGDATAAQLNLPNSVALDPQGNLLVADAGNNRIRRVLGATIGTIMGNGTASYSGDGSGGNDAQLGGPGAVAIDGSGSTYVADTANHRIRRVAPDGTISTVAGNGTAGSAGDGGPATAAQLNSPEGVAVDAAGNLVVADTGNHKIRSITPGGLILTLAGTGTQGFADGSVAAAQFRFPRAVAATNTGAILVADTSNNRIRQISGATVTTVAGSSNTPGFGGDGGPAIAAMLNGPRGVTADAAGTIFIADSANHRLRRVAGGTIQTLAGTGAAGFSGDGGTGPSAMLNLPTGVGVDAAGNVYISDANNLRIRRLSVGGVIDTIGGTGTKGYAGDGGPALDAAVSTPGGMGIDTDGDLSFTDGPRVRKIIGPGLIFTSAGTGIPGFSGDGGPAQTAQFDKPGASVFDGAGNQYIADTNNNRIRKVATNGIVTTVAGSSLTPGFGGDGGPATSAQLARPTSVAVAANGDLFIADRDNHRIRKVAAGTITTVAGDGNAGFGGDGGAPLAASLDGPTGVTVAPGGDLLIADRNNNRIRRVAGGTITTVAGDGNAAYGGDGGAATSASLDAPYAVETDAAGNLYIADTGNNRIRKVAGGTITTLAGDGTADFSGDYGPATAAALNAPKGLDVDDDDIVVVADTANNRVRRITPDGIIATTAGAGTAGASGDGGLATAAQLAAPGDVSIDPTGDTYISDEDNAKQRKVAVPNSVPSAPLTATATPGPSSATVSWTPPIFDGGGAITGYKATASPGGASCSWSSGPLACTISGLTGGQAYLFRVAAINDAGEGPASPASSEIVVSGPPGAAFHAVTPFRALDSRTGPGPTGPIGEGGTKDLTIGGQNGIPPSARAVVMNVTATGGTAASYLNAYPTGGTPPNAANLLFGKGQTVPNLVTVGLGTGGSVTFFNQKGSVHVIADVVGYYDDGVGPGDLFRGTAPTRLLDSRGATGGWGGAALGTDETRGVTVRGAANVPATATAVVMNVTATGGTNASFLQAFPSGATRPVTANLLFGKGQTVPNLVVVGIGPDGKVSLYNQLGSVHVIADVVGYFDPAPGGARFSPIAPTRLLDSRTATGGFGGPVGTNQAKSLQASPSTNVPTGAAGVVLNVTATGGTTASYLAVSPTPGPIPAPTASLLFGKGQTVPNAVIVRLPASGRVDFFNQLGSVHVIADAAGYFTI